MSQDFEIEVLSGRKTLIKYHGNEKEVVIPDGIEIIGGDAFTGNENVINIQIPPTVRQIESGRVGAFWGCGNLLNVILPFELEKIGSSAFSCCKGLTSMKIPDSVTNIGFSAFSHCSKLLSINIPRGVTQVDYAFDGCTSLTKIQIPGNVETIGWKTFEGCTGLISVELENGVREIGREAFSGCSNLTTIILPEGLQKIDDDAFSGCNRLVLLLFPKSINEVSRSAFTHCNPQIELCFYYHHDHLESNQVEGFQCRYVTLVNEDGRKIGKLFLLSSERWDEHQIFLRRLVSGYVDHLSEYDALFSSASDLIIRQCKVAICRLENPLELIDEYRNMYVTYLQNNGKYILPHLIRTGNVTSISCLASINAIPKDNINSYIGEANKLSLLEITAILLNYKNRRWGKDEIPTFTLDHETPSVEWDTQGNVDDTLTITRYKGTATEVTIPAIINGIAVKRISGLLGSLRISVFFPHMEYVRSVVIEEGIEVVGERAFLECQNLGSIHLPESILEIGKEAFYCCTNLESIVFPKNVTKIGPSAFSFCTKLACIEIPRKVERIESHTFSYCTNLNSVKIPNNVIEIGESAFRRCISLESIILPKNLREIGSGAFAGCEKLMSIALPSSITRIRDYIFKDCVSLTSVSIPITTNEIDCTSFENCPNLTIHSPKGSYAIEYAKKNNIKFLEI